MKTLKIGLISLIVALFVFACSQTRTNNPGNSVNLTNAANVANTANAANAANTGSPAVAAETKSPSSPMPDELAAARVNYSENCVKCHKEGGVGGTSEIDGKKIKAPNFTSARMIKDDGADWIESIQNGIPEEGMPAYQDKFSEQEIKDLVKLIRKDFQKK